ncbi:MAG: hypothetical protein COT91_00045, partial [Candidatus Doudnabacteria bacterium CG10_big_fil_rev_8_21_14_0_10_41_10]
ESLLKGSAEAWELLPKRDTKKCLTILQLFDLIIHQHKKEGYMKTTITSVTMGGATNTGMAISVKDLPGVWMNLFDGARIPYRTFAKMGDIVLHPLKAGDEVTADNVACFDYNGKTYNLANPPTSRAIADSL